MAIHIKKSHRGLLHKKLGVAKDKPISLGELNHAMQSKSGAMRKEANFAIQARKWHH